MSFEIDFAKCAIIGLNATERAAQTHVHKYDTSVTRLYNRIAEQRGRKSAVVAAAHKLLLICYSMLKNKRPYYDQA